METACAKLVMSRSKLKPEVVLVPTLDLLSGQRRENVGKWCRQVKIAKRCRKAERCVSFSVRTWSIFVKTKIDMKVQKTARNAKRFAVTRKMVQYFSVSWLRQRPMVRSTGRASDRRRGAPEVRAAPLRPTHNDVPTPNTLSIYGVLSYVNKYPNPGTMYSVPDSCVPVISSVYKCS